MTRPARLERLDPRIDDHRIARLGDDDRAAVHAMRQASAMSDDERSDAAEDHRCDDQHAEGVERAMDHHAEVDASLRANRIDGRA